MMRVQQGEKRPLESLWTAHRRPSQVVSLDVGEDELEVLSLLAVVLDGDGRGALDLPGVALLVVVAVAEPFAEIVPVVNLDERDATGLSHSLEGKRTKTEC